jgi:hypothetical protein
LPNRPSRRRFSAAVERCVATPVLPPFRRPAATARARRAFARARANRAQSREKTQFYFRAENIARVRRARGAPIGRRHGAPSRPPPGIFFCKMVDIQKSRD